MGNVGCFFSILSYFSTTSSSVLCFGLRLFFFSFLFFSPGIGMEMREILFQSLQTFRSNLLYTIYYMPSPKARSRSFFFVYFLFCYFFLFVFLLFLSSWAFFFLLFLPSFLFCLCVGRLMTVLVASLALSFRPVCFIGLSKTFCLQYRQKVFSCLRWMDILGVESRSELKGK